MSNKKRFFEYGFSVGFLKAGLLRSIADVSGITIGHTTKIEGNDVRTGVTVIDPGVKDLFTSKIPAAFYAGNGFGKSAGSIQIEELGTLEAPIALTNTLAVGRVLRGLVDLVLSQEKVEKTQTINAFVGECNDGILNDIHKDIISEKDVTLAYQNKKQDFEIGNVGAGCGTRCFSWKGGIGTSSRVTSVSGKEYTVGALVQTNYGGALEILGVPIGKILNKTDYKGIAPDTDGSCMIIVATDAPLTSRQLKRVAKRAIMGLAKTGTMMRTGSGDFVLAFTTSRTGLEGSGIVGQCLSDEDLNGIFLATAEATEEAVYDALFAAKDMEGRDGNKLEALPVDTVMELLSRNVTK
ncbi:MAG: P1 family peptidase [Candidatus Pacebacteria bacterium]|nr:P1 family peptidase [Candidatus Paceibacterota bacterium]MBP9851244.1 P1 family peptidase [Candidatus Paceibacterota bacterium]